MLAISKNKTQLLSQITNCRKTYTKDNLLVKKIIATVRNCGDRALLDYSFQFDKVTINFLRAGVNDLIEFSDIDLKKAVTKAMENIRVFHQKQIPKGFAHTQEDGSKVSFNWRPINKIGVYVPGGNYPLLSTVLMNVIPAQVAGVNDIIVCTPPQSNGKPDPLILKVCNLLGIKKVFQVGGAQAIAAMAYGTESIPKVDKIVGPGNRYVVAAKQYVSKHVGIDMVAGPTELVIIADESANPAFIAADLISQAEHDKDAFTLLLSTTKSIIDDTLIEIDRLLKKLETKETTIESFSNYGFAFLANSLKDCIEISNKIAPEHLSIQTKNSDQFQNDFVAGAIFIGSQTPVAWGDYWAGPNHTLPTSGASRYRGLLSVFDFLVPYSITNASHNNESIQAIKTMAKAEGLVGHALSAHLRKGDES